MQLAVAGKANCLLTGDRDLLNLTAGIAYSFVTADDFLTSLANT